MGKVEERNVQLRKKYIEMIAEGAMSRDALREIGRSDAWLTQQRKQHPDWANLCHKIRHGEKNQGGGKYATKPEPGTFQEFCEKYLGYKLFTHQLQWIDLLEGREPRDLHPSITFEKGEPNYILINCPPEHSKTSIISTAYPLYRLVCDPDERILLISKTETFAKKLLYQIKNFMTHPAHKELQMAFAPAGGWKDTADQWSTSMVYLNAIDRDTRNKDPNIQAKGIGQQVYGDRATMAIVDDAIVLSNAHQWEDQIEWIQQELLTRLGDVGKLVIVGTRVDSVDMYKEIRNPDLYPSGKSPWTYMAQPAVLDFAEKPKDWVTLWPKSDVPWAGTKEEPGPDGLYRRWDGPTIARRRGVVSNKTWATAYMQQGVQEDAIFPAEVVRKCVSGMRSPGVMHAGAVGYRAKGMEGLYVVCGVDPAMSGDTAMTVLGLDRFTGVRHLLDCRLKTGASPTWLRETMKEVAETFNANEFRVEKNSFQIFLTQDPELQMHMSNRGIVISEHYTGRNKLDPSFGVASMAPLFHNKLIDLPNLSKSEAVRQLVDQLITWYPETKNKQDLVMSLWFAELKCREIMQAARTGRSNSNYVPNGFTTRKQKSMRQIVNLADIAGLGAS